ncbi:MAG TPA: ABC transporter permease [Paenirhodobacter sp.]
MSQTDPPPKPLSKVHRVRFRTMRVLIALMIREMITRYGRSWGGYIWAILEPAGIVAVLSIAFSAFLRTPPIGHSFALFYASGYLVFYFFNQIAAQSGTAIAVNRELMQLPMVRPLDAVIARFMLTFLTLICVASLIFGTLVVMTHTSVDVLHVLRAIVTVSVLGLGVGTVNAVIFTFIPVWRQIWAMLSAPLMILSGTFFLYTSMPGWIQKILIWNPLIHVTGEMRMAFYPNYRGEYISLTYAGGVGIVLVIVGMALVLRNHTALIETP